MGPYAIDWLVARQLGKLKGNLFEISLPRWAARARVSRAKQEWQELHVIWLGVTVRLTEQTVTDKALLTPHYHHPAAEGPLLSSGRGCGSTPLSWTPPGLSNSVARVKDTQERAKVQKKHRCHILLVRCRTRARGLLIQ